MGKSLNVIKFYVFFVFFFFMIRVGSELILPGLAVRVDLVRLCTCLLFTNTQPGILKQSKLVWGESQASERPRKSKEKEIESNKLQNTVKCWFKLLIFKRSTDNCDFSTGNNSFNSSIENIPWSLKDCRFKSGSFSFRTIYKETKLYSKPANYNDNLCSIFV